MFVFFLLWFYVSLTWDMSSFQCCIQLLEHFFFKFVLLSFFYCSIHFWWYLSSKITKKINVFVYIYGLWTNFILPLFWTKTGQLELKMNLILMSIRYLHRIECMCFIENHTWSNLLDLWESSLWKLLKMFLFLDELKKFFQKIVLLIEADKNIRARTILSIDDRFELVKLVSFFFFFWK